MSVHSENTPPLSDSVGARIREKRKSLELTQKQLAEKIGTDPPRMSLIERDRMKPSPRHVIRLSEVLQVSPEWLLYGDSSSAASAEESRPGELQREKLQAFLTYTGLTKSALAREIGVSRTFLSGCFSGVRPLSHKLRHRICQRYGLRPEYFTTDMTIDRAFIRGKPTPALAPAEIDPDLLADRLKRRREQLHLTRAALAEKAGVNASSIWYLETGKRGGRYETVSKIAAALDVSTDWLLYGIVERDPYPLTPEILRFLEDNETLRRWIWKIRESGVDLNSITAPADDLE